MDQVKGTVESTYGEGNKVKVDGIWFSNKFKGLPDGCTRGAMVVVNYNNNPKYKNQFWSSIEVQSPGTGGGTSGSGYKSSGSAPQRSGFPVTYSDHATSIIRQNALTNAIKFCELTERGIDPDVWTVEKVIDIAANFAAWTSGASDAKIREEVEREFDPE